MKKNILKILIIITFLTGTFIINTGNVFAGDCSCHDEPDYTNSCSYVTANDNGTNCSLTKYTETKYGYSCAAPVSSSTLPNKEYCSSDVSTVYVNITADNQNVNYGGNTTIRWSSTNATSCTISDTDNKNYSSNTSGSLLIGPLSKRTDITASCTNNSQKTAYSFTTINVTAPQCEYPKFINISSNTCVSSDECKNLISSGVSCYGSCTPPRQYDTKTTSCVYPVSSNRSNSDLSIQTDDAKNIDQTSAVLWGIGGKIETPTLPITAYFRYSKAVKNPPIYCNDIYGTNMSSTKDIKLGTNFVNQKYGNGNTRTNNSNSFYQTITNLKPDTTYYYCAIISNKENIAYGGEAVVKSFHTSPLETTIKTNDATRVTSTTATINGTYSSVKTIKTYFQYKENKVFVDNKLPLSFFDSIKETIKKILINTALAFDPNEWTKVNEQTHTIGNYSNLYGNINFTLSKLKPSTKYFFRAVVNEDYSKRIPLTTACPTGWSGKWPDCTSYGDTLSFTTKATPEDTPIDLGGTGWGSSCTNGATNYPTCNNNNNTPTCDPPYILNEAKTSCIYDINYFPTVTVTPSSYTFLPSYSYVTINWTSTNATSCTFDDGVTKTRVQTSSELNNTVLSGQGITTRPNIFHPITSTVYSVSCSGAHGTASGNAYIYVNTGGGNNSNLLPSVTITANPSSISPNGSSTISWTSTNATSCDGATDGEARVTETKGSFKTANLTNSKSYSISCTGAHGTASGNAFIYVNTGGGTWTNNGDTGTWTNGTWTTGNYTNGVWTNTGTYTNGSWTNGNSNNNTNYTNNTGIINTPPLTLGQKATPRADDVVRYHEGVETVFSRQIVADKEFAKRYGYEEGNDLQSFAWYLSDQFARMFGYVNESGKEIRVSLPDVAAYQLQLNGSKLTVYEYYYDRIIDIRNTSATLKNASDYEYYFKKR